MLFCKGIPALSWSFVKIIFVELVNRTRPLPIIVYKSIHSQFQRFSKYTWWNWNDGCRTHIPMAGVPMYTVYIDICNSNNRQSITLMNAASTSKHSNIKAHFFLFKNENKKNTYKIRFDSHRFAERHTDTIIICFAEHNNLLLFFFFRILPFVVF